MSARSDLSKLSKREREVMFIVHRMSELSVNQLKDEMDPVATEACARRFLGTLYKKGLLCVRKNGKQKIYSPAASTVDTGIKALRDVLASFFKGSPSLGISNLLDTDESEYSAKELDSIESALLKIRERKDQ